MSVIQTALAPRRPRRTLSRQMGHRMAGWLGVLVIIGCWQLVALQLHTVVFPTFGVTINALADVVKGPDLTTDVLPSIERVLIGFAIGGTVGTVVGLVLGYARALGDYCFAVVDFLRSLPAPLFVPLAIVLLGLGSSMVISIVTVSAVWPALLNSYDGARRVEPLYLDVARASGLSRMETFRLVLLPAALPSVMAGLRLALSTSLAVLVVAEMLGAQTGIGYLMEYAQQTFMIPDTYAGVIILALLGWLFDTVFLIIEHRLLRWEEPFTGGGNA